MKLRMFFEKIDDIMYDIAWFVISVLCYLGVFVVLPLSVYLIIKLLSFKITIG